MTEIHEVITPWLTGNNTRFLLGAGCSVCAKKPLIVGLTNDVLNDMDDDGITQIYNGIKAPSGRPATIEDLINYLIKYKDILNVSKSSNDQGLSSGDIDRWLTQIKKKIADRIADNWESSSVHERFLKRLSMSHTQSPCNIFTLNYDTVIEASLDSLKIPYIDGFFGTNRGWFNPKVYDEIGASIAYRIFKLHGSINWTRDSDDDVRRSRNTNEDLADEPIVVYPSEQKYLQTQYGVYETLINRFRDQLRNGGANNHLIVLGYSFNDNHINEAIYDAIKVEGNHLTVIAFVGLAEDHKKQLEYLNAFSERCNYDFNAFVGDDDKGGFIGQAVGDDTAKEILKAQLWKFENLVDLFAGK